MQKYSTQLYNKTADILNGNSEKTMSFFLLVMFGASFAAYLFFNGMTIVNIINRKNLEKSNLILGSRVSELELNYLSESNKIDLNLAYSLGFKDAVNITFASREVPGKTLSLAKNN